MSFSDDPSAAAAAGVSVAFGFAGCFPFWFGALGFFDLGIPPFWVSSVGACDAPFAVVAGGGLCATVAGGACDWLGLLIPDNKGGTFNWSCNSKYCVSN